VAATRDSYSISREWITQLENETAHVAKLRDAYEAECRRSGHGDDAEVFAAKQRLDVTTCRIDGKKAEIAEKERLLDQAQGREVDFITNRLPGR
jgi:hypothetical protein